ncbi:DNA binding protein, putative [Plasmodium berghei]|uniref:3'-5' exonuclease n=2 Tax=Plasmodium berghei TaxID=5821 RepID=A0A509AEP5_PLABA|nr:3'-5' exonuclease, putative [Plasmodium berghei ANKA]CXH87749.1 DNA binding protein, putative [Plasmodium berghei]SCL90124.1 DNA binding protein, putative [Plasmodium berghei]SCM15224.1 DNA binding protein, putative [Plasmodium berghei]SCM17019.1 DNA binding protein, putative [Plasmodium berghei]SCN21876.1 DNA binding protein, putative [Plasmodium berghei]|eukprot:XP_034419800.1 3'-5' exonuclease, putative [Plasmodium berghei ANKA]
MLHILKKTFSSVPVEFHISQKFSKIENAAQLVSLKFPGNIIYVNKENGEKYNKDILKYLNSNILGFDTEFMINFDENCNNYEYLSKNRKKKAIEELPNIILNKEKNKRITNLISDQSCIKKSKNINSNNKCVEISKDNTDYYADTYITTTKNGCGLKGESKYIQTNTYINKPRKMIENKKLCLIQLCSNDICFVFNINDLNGDIPLSVKTILENNKIIKVCHDIKNDQDMLLSKNIEINNVFDLYNYSIDNYIYPPSLQNLVKTYLKKHLDKEYRLSNWLCKNLNEKQIIYAANDSYASREVYIALEKKNKNDQTFFINLNNENDYVKHSEVNKKCLGGNREYEKLPSKNRIVQNDINHEMLNDKNNAIFNKSSQNEKASQFLQLEKTFDDKTKKESDTLCETKKGSDKLCGTKKGSDKLCETKKGYEYIEKDKLYIINNLKNKIKVTCSKINNISFVEEMHYSNGSYKIILGLKDVENNSYLIKLHSWNYDHEIKCCSEILSYIQNMTII